MKPGRIADFLFVGLSVGPLTLALGGFPGTAMLIFFPLLIAACCFGMEEQVEDEVQSRRGGPGTGNKPPPRNDPGLTATRHHEPHD